MKHFYLSGQRTFGNRGCEAIVRSTVQLLKEQLGDIKVLVPSDDIERDSAQWPEAAEQGVEFVQAYMPLHTRYWVHFQRLPIPLLKRAGWPFPMPAWLKKQIASVDAVLAIGGDNYSLDYRLPSLIVGIDKLAMDMGKPVIIWGASVGPFEAVPSFVPVIREHLAGMSMIFVRENISYSYLTNILKLNNVVEMADPAFTLKKERVDVTPFWPKASENGVLGLNISPLIERYKKNGQNLRAETIQFIHDAVAEGFSVLLVPHVIPLDGAQENNDAVYMDNMLSELKSLGSSVTMMPSHFNASQIKQVISQLQYFIGARTHATIAALSSGIPTLSIAYSVKAKGINKDLLGDMPVILPTPDLTAMSLMAGLEYLRNNEEQIKLRLQEKLPLWRERVETAAKEIKLKVDGDV